MLALYWFFSYKNCLIWLSLLRKHQNRPVFDILRKMVEDRTFEKATPIVHILWVLPISSLNYIWFVFKVLNWISLTCFTIAANAFAPQLFVQWIQQDSGSQIALLLIDVWKTQVSRLASPRVKILALKSILMYSWERDIYRCYSFIEQNYSYT